MTTTDVTTAAGPILAIDLGKYKCVACVYRSATDHTFQSIDTSRTEVARLIERTRGGGRDRSVQPGRLGPRLVR
jgi:hypothetical protein